MGAPEVPVRLSMQCFNTNWVRIFSLLIPVGPPLGLGVRDQDAWAELVDRLS
jgi:hypothetical protein